VALSEREQKLLEQMEQALYAEDPRFASRIRTQSASRSRRRLLIGVVGVLLGLGLVLLGVLNQQIWLGAVGFLAMVGVAVYGFAPARPADEQPAHRPAPKAKGDVLKRFERRWDKREGDQS